MSKENSRHVVLVVGETIDGRLSDGSRDLGKQARQLAGRLGGEPVGVLTGYKNGQAAHSWSEAAGMFVIALEHARSRYPNPTMTASGIEALTAEFSTLAVCFPHSMRACHAAAMVAWHIKAPCVTAVESIFIKSRRPVFKRSVFGGRLCETVSIDSGPVVLTVLPGVFPGSVTDAPDGSFRVETRTLSYADKRFIPQAIHRSADTDQTLEKARVVVAAGRGLGGVENSTLLDAVAGMFKDAAVGGSRGACDLGWLPHSRQIGETGRTVSPALYLACGISGAPQHLAGMRESQTIVAVNTDPKAAICSVAHYAVNEDLVTFLSVLRERYGKFRSAGETK